MKSVHANPPEKICRLCLSDSGVILPIFEGEVSERFSVPLPQKILSCLAIKVCADDPLPPHICHRCLYEVDRFHEFRETCKRTNTTFNKICNNSSESVPFDVNQVLEIKQELHDESVYHDAISELLSDDEGADMGSSRIRKRNRCLSLLESVKRVQQAQSAAAANSSNSVWIEQAKTTAASNTTGSSHINPQLECRFCAKPFLYENTLLEHEELHAKGVVSEEDTGENFEHQVTDPLPIPSPGPVITAAPAPTPAPAAAPADSAVTGTGAVAVAVAVHSSSGSAPNLVHTPTPETDPSAPSTCRPPTITATLPPAQSSDAAEAPAEPVPAPEQVLQTMETQSSEQEPHHQVPQQSGQGQSQEVVDHSSVETVSLTDVTAMLLEGAFEGVKPMSSQTSNLCKYCQEHFSNHDLLKRHERLYCNRKPSLIKHKQSMQQPQLQQIQHQQLQQPQPISQHSQSTHPTIVEAQLVPETHHLVVHQPQELQIIQDPQPQHADQQMIYSQKVAVETAPMESTKSCKHCHKDFVHRGSLWRHQMFCDANPERDLNRIVAGSKKKSVVVKNCGLRNDSQHQGGRMHPTTPVSALRRGGIQTSTGPFKCKFCEKRFLHRGSWWRHQKMFCAVNPEIPTVKAETKVRDIQGVPSFACRYCERTFLHRGSCWHHEQTHTGIKEHACRYCSKTFNEKSRLARHERMHLGIKPFSCRQCGKAFCDASNLRNHEQIHGERASFLCAWCGKSYTRRALLLKHEQVHAGDGAVFSCASCPRTFPDLDLLNDHHSLCHTQDKKRFHLCQTCGQTFRTQNLLTEHAQQVHAQQHPQTQQMQQHIQEPLPQPHQTQEQRLHTCNICSKAFSDASSLQHHELLHNTVQRQYRCHHPACSAVFHQRSQLDGHLLLHQGEKGNPVPTPDTAASAFHHHRPQTHPHPQQLISTHEMQHPQALHHELLHREGAYVIGEQDLAGQTISVHHLVSQLPQ